ncbi:(d)CMP kinase [Mangrovimonas sp. ST2L15]|uniref:(d)CMP kinase n=1 Tax=Mangrovimonas sp. ST2L15 TaxID=1645916 RepID=UPI0006B599B2|nr:(d)CMP kinase [Mangrovimonas sp. ST2L15]
MDKITIAIDGYSSTGKSTVAKKLASKLGYVYVDSGAMYRVVTLFAMRHEWIDDNHFDKGTLISKLEDIELAFHFNPEVGFAEVYLNGENVEKEIRTLDVSSFVSQVAAVPEVRTFLVKKQRKLGEDKGVVMDGRDIGTVVFPNAELKIFMTASEQVRAQRRYEELKARGDQISFDDVLNNVRERDHIDSTRKQSPLKRAEGAIDIDNSYLTEEQVFSEIMDLVQKAIDSEN